MNCIGCPAMGLQTEIFPFLPDGSNGLNHFEAGSCRAIPVRFHNTKNTRRCGFRTKDYIVVLWYSLAPIEMDKKINEDLFVN